MADPCYDLAGMDGFGVQRQLVFPSGRIVVDQIDPPITTDSQARDARIPELLTWGYLKMSAFFSGERSDRVVQAKPRPRENGHYLVKFLAKRGDRTSPVWRTQRR